MLEEKTTTFSHLLEVEVYSLTKKAVAELVAPSEMFADLNEVSIVSELSDVFRVSDDVIRAMSENGMPHFHAGRELRFNKILLIEWQRTGQKYSCEICAAKKSPKIGENLGYENLNNVTSLSSKANKKLAKMAEC